MLAVNRDTRSVVVRIVDPVSTEILSTREVFDAEWTPIGLTMVLDPNGDSTAEVGVLAIDQDNIAVLRILDPISGEILKDVSFEEQD